MNKKWIASVSPLVLGLLLGGLFLTVAFAWNEKNRAEEVAEQRFTNSCKVIQAAIEVRLSSHEQILRSGAAFFADDNGVTRAEWHVFAKTQRINQTLPGILGVGFAQVVPHEQLAQHTLEIRAEGFPDYRVWPEHDREIYSSIIFLEPFNERNMRAFGYDMLSEPVRREAMERARDENSAALSGRVLLVQETKQDIQAGTLMYLPVYRMGLLHNTLAERRAAIIGWVYSPYRMNDLLQGVLGHLDLMDLGQIHLKIFDDGTASPETLLYDSHPGGDKQPAHAIRFNQQTVVEAAGRRWLLSFAGNGKLGCTADYSKFWLWLIGGTAISLLLSGLIFRDQKAERANRQGLEENEARFRNLLQRMEIIPVQGYNERREVIYWNDASVRVYGYAEEEAMGRKREDLIIPPGRRDEVVRLSDAWHAGGAAIPSSECVLRNKAGQPVNVFSSHIMHITSSGKHEMFCIDVDLRDLKAAENQMRASQQLTEMIINTIPVRVFWKDANLVYLGCNEAFAHDAGFSNPQEIIGKNIRQMEGQDQAEMHSADDRRVIAGETILNKEEHYTNPEGKHITLLASKVPLRNSQGAIVGMLGSYVDITGQRLLEEQLQQAQKMESIGQLAAGVAHDFNNKLQIILGFSEVALNSVDPASNIHADLNEIGTAAKQSADLTRQLLTFARKQNISPKILDLNASIEHMLKMLRRLIGENTDLLWHPAGDLWPVNMDPTQVDQILANLCVNARDAIDGVGSITIETQNTTLDDTDCTGSADALPGDYLMLSISDNGCGMDKELLAHIYEPFFTSKAPGQGTGLGLATIYGIVKQNSGIITVDSTPGKGTTFKIYLPRCMEELEQPPEGAQKKPPMQGRETILLVEDSPALLNLVLRMLETLGYTVLAAELPSKALSLANEYPGKIDALVTDVIMPEANGPELSAQLKSLRPNLKCLFMSGYTADAMGPDNILSENVHFIQKPFEIETIAAKLRKVLVDD